MSDYIKREDALHLIERNRICANVCEFKSTKEFYLLAHDHIKGLIELISSADVVERKHGEWILEYEPNGKPYCFHCSVCDGDFHYIGITTAYPFCPNCGADMRGEPPKGEEE